MLAHGEELDVAHDDDLVVVGLERRGEELRRVLPHAAEKLRAGACHAGGRVQQAFPRGVLPHSLKNQADTLLDLVRIHQVTTSQTGHAAGAFDAFQQFSAEMCAQL